MNPLEFIEHFLALASNSFSSWPSITTNALTVMILFFSRNIIHSFYVTLQGMNNMVTNITFLLFLLTLYGIIYRSVSGAFKAVQHYRDAKNKKLEQSRRLETLKNSLLTLSKSEIAILKFILTQDNYSAWLYAEAMPVIMLETKQILRNIDLTKNKIHNNILYSPYQLVHEAHDIITHMPLEFLKKWRKIKPDRSLEECQ